jgi:hypothetical protein
MEEAEVSGPDSDDSAARLAALETEVDQRRAENDRLRSAHRVPAVEPTKKVAPVPLIRVLLLPDPTADHGPLGPQAALNIARIGIRRLRESQPDADWRAEHDLAAIPDEAQCFQLGEVMRRMFSGEGPDPKLYRVEDDPSGGRVVRRCTITGEAESDRFSTGYARLMQISDELMTEGQAAYRAGAEHHAQWTLKAVDLVLATAKLSLVSFQSGGNEWKTRLELPRPEYDPRYAVPADLPVGF